MIYRCILPEWASKKYPELPKVKEGEYTEKELIDFNEKFYNIYFLPNHPSMYDETTTVDGSHIDTFNFIFVDFDIKSNTYPDKNSFIKEIQSSEFIPTYIVDSGNGIHVYWQVTDLDAWTYLTLQRRLMRRFNTDPAICKIYQLMRMPSTFNTKDPDNLKLCEYIVKNDNLYTSEDVDKLLPKLTSEDEKYCRNHYDKTYSIKTIMLDVDDKIPFKFSQLMKNNKEVQTIWSGNLDDRSNGDFRLGHIMFASGFTKKEALSVLVNCAKALQRTPAHRIGYATNIVDKIWLFEETNDKNELNLSSTVREILDKGGDSIKGTRFPCWSYLDATLHGFRLGQVIGLVAGSGVGKTAVALNMFMGFVQNNPDYDHFFIPLEQPVNEIADRWKTMCGNKEHLYEKVHVISNYDNNGQFRHLSFDDIRQYLLKFQETTGKKVGCVVIDHIGALKKKGKNGENQDLMDICHSMKAFAVETNTLLVMQSQAPREKAGIGDLELNKDSAYGTVFFESYCDYLITIHQPLKRVYKDGAPTVTSFKFCKIRHKKQGQDIIEEDVNYKLFFDPHTEHLRELTQDEEKSFTFFHSKAANIRKQDRKTDLVQYKSVKWNS